MFPRAVLLAALIAAMPGRADDTAEASVKQALEKLGAANGKIEVIKDRAVETAVPKCTVVAVHFPLFPVARAVPEPLSHANVAVVKDGKVTFLSTPKALADFFLANASAAKNETEKKDAARAWLRLSQEMKQDGYFKFELMDDSTKVEGNKATAKIVVMRGGNGELVANLEFGDDGKLTGLNEKGNITAGQRPKCHATLLLDNNPLVRRIVEEDLLIMGRAVKPYLDEQRAKASPELQKAIDRIWERIERASGSSE